MKKDYLKNILFKLHYKIKMKTNLKYKKQII